MQHVSPVALEGTPVNLVSCRETDEAYHAVVATVDAKRRVINCKDDLQWIVQHRRGNEWRSVSFCRRRDPLIRVLEWDGKKSTRLPPTIRKVLEALPHTHP